MKDIINKFPDWRVRKLISDLRNRHLYYSKEKDNHIKPSDRTWYQCYKNNRDKLLYRNGYRTRPVKNGTNNWNYMITSQKQKLIRHYESLHLWRMREYECLEKMNAHDFPQDDSANILWHYVILRQKKKLYKINIKKNARSSNKNSWGQLIYRIKLKLHRQYQRQAMIAGTALWDWNISANREKLYNIHSKDGWNSNINVNFWKLKRRSRLNYTVMRG